MSVDQLTNFYCSQKFTWLSVDLEKRLSYSCCSATPEKIDINWLKKNPGQLFNTPMLQKDRVDMLNNQPVPSCSDACWKPEQNGLESRRTISKSYIPIQSKVEVQQPTHLNITLGSTCNLTCSYCCKQYSSAWYRDIESHGPYGDRDRYTLTPLDRIVAKISNKEHQESVGANLLLEEIFKFDQVNELRITGGEPFLYNEFPKLLNNLPNSSRVSFYTGLGVDHKRLQKQLKLIQPRQNLKVYVSAENCGAYYEFNRYGNSYNNFLSNLNLLIDLGFSVEFNSVVSNLTVFGISEFAEKFEHIPTTYQFCNSPEFLAVNVLDDKSKQFLVDQLSKTKINRRTEIISNIQQPCNDSDLVQCSQYIKEFSRRRNLSLDIFPRSMLQWLKI